MGNLPSLRDRTVEDLLLTEAFKFPEILSDDAFLANCNCRRLFLLGARLLSHEEIQLSIVLEIPGR